MSISRTGFVFDEHYLGHDTGVQTTVFTRNGSFEVSPEPHPSSLYIIQRIKEFLDGSGLTSMMQPIAARAASANRPSNQREDGKNHRRGSIALGAAP